MRELDEGSVDLTVTSPPYDNLRTYNGTAGDWNEGKWQQIIDQLYRVTKPGGVVVWVVGDATINGSETGTSFKQALWAMRCGFRLHDTMIYEKAGMMPTQDRYYSVFEYMFVLSKGKPQALNFIADHANKKPGATRKKEASINKGRRKEAAGGGWIVSPEFSRRSNIWRYAAGHDSRGDPSLKDHPAIFPEKLAQDHILSWSNEGDTVFDPFLGSGTTGKMAILHGRDFIGIEREPTYYAIAEKRINDAMPQTFLEAAE